MLRISLKPLTESTAVGKKTSFSSKLRQLSSAVTSNQPVATFDFDKVRNEIIEQWVKEEAKVPGGMQTTARYCCFTYNDAKRAYLEPSASWHWLDRELSSNLAGETGATYIYKGALTAMNIRFSNHTDAINFCQDHMANESFHLSLFQSVIPEGKHTKLLPIWRLAGWTLGFLPTILCGPKGLYVTVEAVETFVEEHFQEQIVPLKKQCEQQQKLLKGAHEPLYPELIRLLEHCCEDEVHHKEDAARHLLNNESQLDAWWIKPWSKVVRRGSIAAAEIARRF